WPGEPRPLSLQPQSAICLLDPGVDWAGDHRRFLAHAPACRLDGFRLRADGAHRGGLARPALRCALSRVLRAHPSLCRSARADHTVRAEKAFASDQLSVLLRRDRTRFLKASGGNVTRL